MHRAEEGELRLFVAGEGAGVEREIAAHALGELGSVGGVTHGGGEHGEVGGAVVVVDQLAIAGERPAGALDRCRRERARGVDAFAEPRDGGAPEEFLYGPGRGDVGDQQPGGVGSDVDDRDACHAPRS